MSIKIIDYPDCPYVSKTLKFTLLRCIVLKENIILHHHLHRDIEQRNFFSSNIHRVFWNNTPTNPPLMLYVIWMSKVYLSCFVETLALHRCIWLALSHAYIWYSKMNYWNKLNFHLTSVHFYKKKNIEKFTKLTKFSYTLQDSYLFMSQIGQNKTQSTFSHIGYAISHSHAAWGSHCSLYRNQFNLDRWWWWYGSSIWYEMEKTI